MRNFLSRFFQRELEKAYQEGRAEGIRQSIVVMEQMQRQLTELPRYTLYPPYERQRK